MMPDPAEASCFESIKRAILKTSDYLPDGLRAPLLLKAAQAAETRRHFHGEISNERMALNLLQALLPQDPVIIQGGAYVGNLCLEMAERWPEARIHAFEAAQDLSRLAHINTRRHPNITIYPKALARSPGRFEFYRSSGNGLGSSSLLAPLKHREAYPQIDFPYKEFVDATTLTEFVLSKKIPRIDLLWLDLQGGELDALRGGSELLAHIPLVFVEVNLVEMYKGGAQYPELRQWMENRGYQVVHEFLEGKNRQGDVLFMKKRI